MEELKRWIDVNFSKVNFFDRILWRNYLSVLGVVSSFVTLISFFGTAQNIEFSITCAASVFIATLILIFLCMWWNANHQKCVRLNINGTQVRVQEGDIFELFEKKLEDRSGEICVIGVNDYYDTIVDDRIVAKKNCTDNISCALRRLKN